MPVRLGYACIHNNLRENGILDPITNKYRSVYCSRSLTLESVRRYGLEEVEKRALMNVKDLLTILQHNEAMGIRFFRITSNLFPHMGNPKAKKYLEDYNMEFANEYLKEAGKYAKEHAHRLTFHPGQYVQLSSKNKSVVEQSIVDLTIHAEIFMRMGLKPNMGSVMVIHGGGHFGDREESLARFKEEYQKIPKEVSQYISLENDEIYSASDLLPICEELNIPFTPDYFHDTLNSVDYRTGQHVDIYSLTGRIINTWRTRGIKPKCHLSGQKHGAKRGAHSDCITHIPEKLLQIADKYDMDIMLETKKKEECTLHILNQQFIRIPGTRVEWIIK